MKMMVKMAITLRLRLPKREVEGRGVALLWAVRNGRGKEKIITLVVL